MNSFWTVIVIFYSIALASCNHKSLKERAAIAKDTTRSEVEYFNYQQQDDILNAAEKDTATVISLGTAAIISQGQGGEGYYLIRRTVPGYVEQHEQWDDVVIIRSGHGVLRTGTKVKGEQKSSGGEMPWRNWYDGEIEDASERNISPGDFIIIPAMTAHQYIPAKGDTLIYWTVKIKRIHQ